MPSLRTEKRSNENFIDTSSLVKLYHHETGTDRMDELFEQYLITEIYLSELIRVEFASAIWKKVRTKELTEKEAENITKSFEYDSGNYSFIEITGEITDCQTCAKRITHT